MARSKEFEESAVLDKAMDLFDNKISASLAGGVKRSKTAAEAF